MEWLQAKVFRRTSNIYTFSKDPLLQKNIHVHLYMPWKEESITDFMFKLKAHLKDYGHAWIPYMQTELSPQSICHDDLADLKTQLENMTETHLVMSNLDSIHILSVAQVERKPENLDFWSQLNGVPRAQDYHFWIQVEDFYVHTANHQNDEESVKEKLAGLLGSQQTQDLFVGQSGHSQTQERLQKRSKWLELNRSLTYDYFTRSCELERHVYHHSWAMLSRRTQHFLVLTEQFKHQAGSSRGHEKFLALSEGIESLLSAIVNELNEIYIRPVHKAFELYPNLNEIWEKVKSDRRYCRLESVQNIEDFLEYAKIAKSLLFTLKNHFTKRIDKEEFLLIENFLSRQEGLIESFHTKDLEQRFATVIKMKVWIKSCLNSVGELNSAALDNLNLKLSHILSLMSGASYEDNLFFRLIEEKTSKSQTRKRLEEEVDELVKEYVHRYKIAS